MTHEAFRELLPLYVLGALDGDELRSFERYVAGNRERCEAEIAEFQSVADKLALSAPSVEPSPEVFDRVIATIKEEEPATRNLRDTTTRERDPIDLAALIFRWLPWAVTVVFCVLFFVTTRHLNSVTADYRLLSSRVQEQTAELKGQISELLTLAAQLESQNKTLHTVNEQLTTEKADLIRATSVLQQKLDSQGVRFASMEKTITDQTAMLELLMDPAIRVANLADPKGESKAVARVYWHSVTKQGVIKVSNLKPVLKGKGQSLELWTFCGNKPPAATQLFWTDESGQGVAQIKVPGDLACVDKFAVTVEATEAEPFAAPKGAVVLIGQ